MISGFDSVENTVGKGENAAYRRVIKSLDCVRKLMIVSPFFTIQNYLRSFLNNTVFYQVCGSSGPDKSGQMRTLILFNPDERTHIKQDYIETTISCSPQVGLKKK